MADTPSQDSVPPPAPRPVPLARNIVLVGFMATGKTTLGKVAARKLGFQFVDTDKEVEKLAGKSIPKIFAEDGENTFRDYESAVLRTLASRDRCVISTGGGIVTRPDNLENLQKLGFVVWLHTKKQVIFDRVSRNPHRPLLQTADPFGTICALVDARKPLYKSVADLKVKTTKLSPSEAVVGISESALWFFRTYFPDNPEAENPTGAAKGN